jgi:8-amino-7-oxononanoate synthase
VYCNPVISPAVPPGMALLRTSYMATHTEEQMDRVLGIFATVGKEMGII